MGKQSDIFLQSEGNKWFERNKGALKIKDYYKDDFIISELIDMKNVFENKRVLEIGCADGSRLRFLKEEFNCEVYGIDPSIEAISEGLKEGLNLRRGLADNLEFENDYFDVVIFGFCLYLCDRADLFKIAYEVDRVTKKESWVVILDFYSPTENENAYVHYGGLTSYKFDNRKIFDWHPSYTCVVHKVKDHNNFNDFTDVKDDWIAISILRKQYE